MMKLVIIKFLKIVSLILRKKNNIKIIEDKSKENKIKRSNCKIIRDKIFSIIRTLIVRARLTKLILRKILNVEKIVILKILKMGGLIVRERGYV